MPLLVPISVGELLDKLTILELKAAAIDGAERRANVLRELAALDLVRRREIPPSAELDALSDQLRAVNRRLWQTEDRLRQCERDGLFGAAFIELARGVYRDNDRRALLKRQINQLTGSDIVEEKSYL